MHPESRLATERATERNSSLKVLLRDSIAQTAVKNAVVICWTLIRVTIAIVLVGWCALYLRRFDSHFLVVLPLWTCVPGLILLLIGGLLVLWCGGILSTRGILSSEDWLFPKEFVALGPFRHLRNPMSLGVVVLMIGLGLYERSVSILLFACLLFVLLHLVVVYVEEPGLATRFGPSYQAYKRSVNRWVPNIKPTDPGG